MINPPLVRKVRLVHQHLAASHMCSLVSALLFTIAHAQIGPSELVAPKMEIAGGNLIFTIQPSLSGRNYQLQCSDSMAGGTWTDVGVLRSGDGDTITISTPYVVGVQKRFHRIAIAEATPAPAGFVLIPAGSFQMGEQSNPLVGSSDELPVHSVYVSAFFMGKYEVTNGLWDEVRAWGLNNGYADLVTARTASKGASHPVNLNNWYAMVKWCNARSQKDGLTPCYTVSGATYKTGVSNPDCNWNASGYRLPTEAEWEKAARGGMVGKNFPWGTDTITHSQANYNSYSSYAYDVSPTRGFHPTYKIVGASPYTSPVGSFAPNGYGLYDMAGNMWEWCWDWYSSDYYASSPTIDPRGPSLSSGSSRVKRGGKWDAYAPICRVAYRANIVQGGTDGNYGFRVARSSVP